MTLRYTLLKILCIILPLLGASFVFKFAVWNGIKQLRNLNNELEFAKSTYQIKEANLENADENAIRSDNYSLTDMGEVVFAALAIGNTARERGLVETAFNTDRSVNQLGSDTLVQTRINFGLIGQFGDVLDYLRSLKGKYIFNSVRLSSVGMENGMVSTRIELSVFSLLSPEATEHPPATRDYFEGSTYGNPFRYDN